MYPYMYIYTHVSLVYYDIPIYHYSFIYMIYIYIYIYEHIRVLSVQKCKTGSLVSKHMQQLKIKKKTMLLIYCIFEHLLSCLLIFLILLMCYLPYLNSLTCFYLLLGIAYFVAYFQKDGSSNNIVILFQSKQQAKQRKCAFLIYRLFKSKQNSK